MFYLLAFDSIKFLTGLAPQNDRLNLSFVKDFHVVGTKMTRNGRKRPFMRCKFSGCFFTKLKKLIFDNICVLWHSF